MIEHRSSHSAGPWLAAGIAFGTPATAAVWMMSRSWSPWLTVSVIGALTAVALQLVRVLAPLIWASVHNARARDDAHTRTIVDGVARPAFTDGREQLALTQGMAAASTSLGRAAAVWERMETGAHAVTPAEVEPAWPPVRMWDQPKDDGGHDDDDA